jgi:large subunit ribosomal protein L14
MIMIGTKLLLSDNSGARGVRCIKIYNSRVGMLGDIILVSVIHTISREKSKAKKGKMYRALITECAKQTDRRDGSSIAFSQNKVIILSANNQPLATRLTGLLPNEFREKGFSKILTLGAKVV